MYPGQGLGRNLTRGAVSLLHNIIHIVAANDINDDGQRENIFDLSFIIR